MGATPIARFKSTEEPEGYNLWNPPPDFQERLKEYFKDLKIDPTVVIDEEQIAESLKGLEKQLEPFKARPLSPDFWTRQICTH